MLGWASADEPVRVLSLVGLAFLLLLAGLEIDNDPPAFRSTSTRSSRAAPRSPACRSSSGRSSSSGGCRRRRARAPSPRYRLASAGFLVPPVSLATPRTTARGSRRTG
ncbi:MAG: hypothetical protein M3312_02840 [Actinomycetota bacterium]|nr:hypothetical protein [Actinomycetota bacterium]